MVTGNQACGTCACVRAHVCVLACTCARAHARVCVRASFRPFNYRFIRPPAQGAAGPPA